jgi:hypothetical protein
MKWRRLVPFLGAAAVAAGVIGASTASAATLIGDYQLQGTLASSAESAKKKCKKKKKRKP